MEIRLIICSEKLVIQKSLTEVYRFCLKCCSCDAVGVVCAHILGYRFESGLFFSCSKLNEKKPVKEYHELAFLALMKQKYVLPGVH